jgi:hypothetical protein
MKRVTPKKPADETRSEPPVAAPASPDVALIHGVTPDGEGFKILRARGDRLELGAVRPLREGAPITGEVVTLRPRPNFPALCDVETHFKPAEDASHGEQPAPAPLAARTGPAQVATDEYRRNWDAIWKSTGTKSKLVN